MQEIYIGEYSLKQNCYHIDTLEAIINANVSQIKRKLDTGYLPICYGNSFAEVSDKLTEFKKTMPTVDFVKQYKEGYSSESNRCNKGYNRFKVR